MSKIKNITTPNAGEDMNKLNCAYIGGENIKWHSYSGKQSGSLLGN